MVVGGCGISGEIMGYGRELLKRGRISGEKNSRYGSPSIDVVFPGGKGCTGKNQ